MATAPNSKALTKRAASGPLMAPPPAPKRIKRPQIVLDEDTYTESLAYIIKRDFFPGLLETDAQHEYLDALNSNDNRRIREAGEKLTAAMTPLPSGYRRPAARKTPTQSFGAGSGATPKVWGGDTPYSVAGTEFGGDEERDNKPEVDLNLSLSAFQEKYTSEDQESFSQIIDKHNAERFLKNHWLRNGNMLPSKQRLAQQKVLEARPASKEVALRPSQNLDDRPAAPNTTRHVGMNSLMFNPDSIEDWASTNAQKAEAASLAPPKAILFHNTRLPPEPADPPRPPSPTLSAVRDAIAGRPRLGGSEVGNESDLPVIKGYALVDPQAPQEEEQAPRDLLTRFGVEAQESHFKIADSHRREKLHHKMVEQIGEKRAGKDKGSAAGNQLGLFTGETPRFLSAPTPRLGGMTPGRRTAAGLTPAARHLYERMGGATPKPKIGGGVFGDERREWKTPTSGMKRKG